MNSLMEPIPIIHPRSWDIKTTSSHNAKALREKKGRERERKSERSQRRGKITIHFDQFTAAIYEAV